MKYIELFLNTNIYVMFILTIYIIFFYIKNNYNDYKKNISEEIILTLITFILMILCLIYKYEIYTFYLTIGLILLFEFNKYHLSIIISLIQSAYIFILIGNIYFATIYIIDYLVYCIYHKINKSKILLTHLLVIINTIFILIYVYLKNCFNYKNILLIIIYITTIYILTYYIILLKKRVKLYSTLEDIQKDKLLKTSIFKVTHEIKNPLAVIKGYLSLFDSNNPKKCEKYRKILEKEVENALIVLKDFSDIHNMKIVKEYMSVNELLYEVKITIMPFFNNKRINLYIDSEKDLNMYADYNRLKQVFINILKNSSEALEENGKINISAYKSSNKIIITIKDNGCGMDDETITNLFTPFYSKKQSGTGLGLCLSKEIIENHGGSIKYSSSINNWTKVKISIPIN